MAKELKGGITGLIQCLVIIQHDNTGKGTMNKNQRGNKTHNYKTKNYCKYKQMLSKYKFCRYQLSLKVLTSLTILGKINDKILSLYKNLFILTNLH